MPPSNKFAINATESSDKHLLPYLQSIAIFNKILVGVQEPLSIDSSCLVFAYCAIEKLGCANDQGGIPEAYAKEILCGIWKIVGV